ncbi:starch-binding protein [Myxococcota bacterium]|nr:starch-binding protein [Myxococcota bacterium]MBU1898378.1 starch-binding protein [Myxococcota bacterium]
MYKLRRSAVLPLIPALLLVGCDGDDDPNTDAGAEFRVEAPTISPASGTYDAPLQVTLSAAPGVALYYTINGAETLTYLNPFELSAGSYEVAAFAVDGARESEVNRATYEVTGVPVDEPPGPGMTVHFKRPAGWSTPLFLHYWGTTPDVGETDWPGVEMQDEGFDWWRYTIEEVTSAQLVVHDNRGQQSEDLSRASEGWYVDGQWHDANPDGLVVHFKPPEGWGTPIYIHYWDTTPEIPPTEWPGEEMISEGDGWFLYMLMGVRSAHMVFNAGEQQTGDLSRGAEGWYTDERWYDHKPSGVVEPEVPVITASPAPGRYPAAQTVTLNSTHDDDVIFYTTDGAAPTPQSRAYAGPIEVRETTTIKALGVNRANRSGDVATFTYTIGGDVNDQPPTAALSVSPSRLQGAGEVTLDASASRDPEGQPMQIRWDYRGDGQWTGWAAFDARAVVTHAYNEATDFDVVVEVKDAGGQVASASRRIAVGGLEPLGDFREETIYFLMTARWNNGDPSNDYYNRDRYAQGDPQWRGDFKGLIERLDYIQDLGFTALWITPPIENRSGLDYHGYHGYDWYMVDPRLESPGATYQDLINEAHARGIKIIQDVVVNHSSQYGIRGQVWIDHLPIKYYVEQGSQQGSVNLGPYQGNLGDYRSPFREDNDNPVAPAWFRERQTRDPEGVEPLVDPLTGQTVPASGYNPNRFFGIDAMTLDSNWYHLDGFMAGGDWENPGALQQKHMAGDCIDLATERQNVQDYINGAVYQYLDMGVDAIRVDTVKHVERSNLLDDFVNRWKAHRPGLFVFGENLVKGHGWGDLGGDNGPSQIRPWWYTRLGDDPRDPNSGGDSGFSVLDFGLFSTFRDNVKNGHYGGIGGVLGMDWVYGDATQLVTFLQNHDVGPDNDFKYRFQGDQWMAAAAYNMLWTIRGIPCLYYGEEIEFQKSMPQDIGHGDLLADTGRAYFGDHLSAANIGATRAHPLYQHIKRLNQIRRAVPALQKGQMDRVNEWGGGMSFTRDWNNGESYVVVGLAIGGGQDISVDGARDGSYTDAVTGNTLQVSGGHISFHVQGNSAGIYVLNGPGKIGQDGVYLK